MDALSPQLTVTKTPGIKKKLNDMYINYMQMMIDCARDPELKEKLFADNEARVKYLNEKVGMTIPESVHVVFDTTQSTHVKIYMKDADGQIFIDETGSTLNVNEKLKSGEIEKESMTLTKQEEVEMDVTDILDKADVVLKLPFIDPSGDLMLFELKYDKTEIIFSTCIA